MTATGTARRLALVGVLALLVSLLPLAGAYAQTPTPTPTPSPGDGEPIVYDLSGSTNVDYSIAWSQLAFPQATIDAGDGPTEVLIGRDDLFADNLASGVLQGGTDTGRPLLLTDGDSLSSDTLDELDRLNGSEIVDPTPADPTDDPAGGDTITEVIILGGTAAVSEDVEDALNDAGYDTSRLEGQTRIETAIDIADEVTSDTVIVARAFQASDSSDETQAFADSLAAGAWAAEEGWPVLLTEFDVLTGNTADALAAGGYDKAFVVGGTQAVSDDVLAEIDTIVGDAERVSGPTRFDTAVAIANERGFDSADDATTILVEGQDSDAWADGFSAALVAGVNDYPIVLANGDDLPDATADFVGASSSFAAHFTDVVGICGPSVSSDACEAFADALGATIVAFPPPVPPAPTGPISLDQTSAQAGTQITGTVTDPGTVQSISVTGCGFNNENVTVSGDGNFTLTIPANQAPGACSLVFNVLRSGGATETSTIPFTVTAGPASTTEAPDLVSATLNATTNVVTYTFDETLAASVLTPNNFSAYLPGGTRLVPTNAQVSGSTVIAQFTNTVDPATVAAIADAAVQDAQGRFSYASSAPLTGSVSAPGVTEEPDLQTVSNFRVEIDPITMTGAIVGDFRFDEQVFFDDADPTFDEINAGGFFIIASDSTQYNGLSVTQISADRRTVTVRFAGTTMVPIGSITRGGVQSDTVEDTSGPTDDDAPPVALSGNALQTEPRTVPPALVPGALSDRTDDPDLTGVAVAGTNIVAFTFDEPVNLGAVAGNFRVYDASSTEFSGSSAVRSGTSTYNVTFPAGAVGSAVGASVFTGAVTAVDDMTPNAAHELPLQQVASTAGRTALPDLVSVTISVDAFGQNKVVYRFDSALPVAYTAPAADYGLIDAQGTLFTPAAAGTINTDRTEVTFSIQGTSTNGFTNAQAAAAVIGNVEDQANLSPAQPQFTEGDVPVMRTQPTP